MSNSFSTEWAPRQVTVTSVTFKGLDFSVLASITVIRSTLLSTETRIQASALSMSSIIPSCNWRTVEFWSTVFNFAVAQCPTNQPPPIPHLKNTNDLPMGSRLA
jgi:hypothetical protein